MHRCCNGTDHLRMHRTRLHTVGCEELGGLGVVVSAGGVHAIWVRVYVGWFVLRGFWLVGWLGLVWLIGGGFGYAITAHAICISQQLGTRPEMCPYVGCIYRTDARHEHGGPFRIWMLDEKKTN